jgi:hypothetical protein
MVASSPVGHRVQGVPTMSCPKGEHWLPTERMAEKATCHVRSVCPGTACRTGISARKQKSEHRGNRASIIAKHGAPEPHMGSESLPRTQHVSRMRVKRTGLTGASAMGRECHRQILGSWKR